MKSTTPNDLFPPSGSVPDTPVQRDIYTVSRLNSEVKAVLGGSFPLVWVEGELSNLARPASGHIYFTLKDGQSQVRCALFRMRRQLLRFQPQNGDRVLLRARITLYEARGEYQLVAEHMEPAGEGALLQAFEALKSKLQAEGLFDTERKRPLPSLPRQIGIITSPSGAAIQDILTVLARRCPMVPALIYPSQVQGDQAAGQLVEALRLAEQRQECDVLILARGGGSLEDLMAFNDEALARQIDRTTIPLIAAIGHEVDFTIADFVADHRAPTPSAAAELAVPEQSALLEQVQRLVQRLSRYQQTQQRQQQTALNHLQQRLQRCHPGQQLQERAQRLDDLDSQQRRLISDCLFASGQRLHHLRQRLSAATPRIRLRELNNYQAALKNRLHNAAKSQFNRRQLRLQSLAGELHALSPLSTLQRGYSITRRAEDNRVINRIESVTVGDRLVTRLTNGSLHSRIESIDDQ